MTTSGIVRVIAIDFGTPNWSSSRLGSGVMTVHAEKSTLLPIRLPLSRPSLPLSLDLIDLIFLPPDLLMAEGAPERSLLINVEQKY